MRGYGTPVCLQARKRCRLDGSTSAFGRSVSTFLILFALALTIPLLGLGIFALNRMAA